MIHIKSLARNEVELALRKGKFIFLTILDKSFIHSFFFIMVDKSTHLT